MDLEAKSEQRSKNYFMADVLKSTTLGDDQQIVLRKANSLEIRLSDASNGGNS